MTLFDEKAKEIVERQFAHDPDRMAKVLWHMNTYTVEGDLIASPGTYAPPEKAPAATKRTSEEVAADNRKTSLVNLTRELRVRHPEMDLAAAKAQAEVILADEARDELIELGRQDNPFAYRSHEPVDDGVTSDQLVSELSGLIPEGDSRNEWRATLDRMRTVPTEAKSESDLIVDQLEAMGAPKGW